MACYNPYSYLLHIAVCTFDTEGRFSLAYCLCAGKHLYLCLPFPCFKPLTCDSYSFALPLASCVLQCSVVPRFYPLNRVTSFLLLLNCLYFSWLQDCYILATFYLYTSIGLLWKDLQSFSLYAFCFSLYPFGREGGKCL